MAHTEDDFFNQHSPGQTWYVDSRLSYWAVVLAASKAVGLAHEHAGAGA